VLELLEEHGEHPQQIRCLGVRDRFVEHGSQARLREANEVSPDAIIAEAQRLVSHGRTFLPALFNGIRSRLERIV